MAYISQQQQQQQQQQQLLQQQQQNSSSSFPSPSSAPSRIREGIDRMMRLFTTSQPVPLTRVKPNNEEEEEEDYDQVLIRQQQTEAFAEHLSHGLPKETKAKRYELANAYSDCQTKIVKNLWSLIEETRPFPTLQQLKQGPITGEHLSMFQLLENLYCALEELCFTFPTGFHTQFVTLGYHVLPRHVFVQYLDRGIFRITSEFIEHLNEELGDSTSYEDCHFKFSVATQMKVKGKMIKQLRKFPENAHYMSEYALSTHKYQEESSDDEEEGEGIESRESREEEEDEFEDAFLKEHEFIPFNFFLQNMQKRSFKQLDLLYISQAYSHVYSNQKHNHINSNAFHQSRTKKPQWEDGVWVPENEREEEEEGGQGEGGEGGGEGEGEEGGEGEVSRGEEELRED
eukprot:Lithocolla_globosa_v1_NODE_860_length_3174_cov_3.716896.p2 type:complete len:400 gc:universal NODE_860_length_3174_cov_3.716896:1537-2736(+)